jgi:sporulation protein YlmC with PRC-barrel domain
MDRSEPQEITSLVGREVYSNNGVFVGEVKDLQLDIEQEVVTGLAMREVNYDLFENRVSGSQGIIVPYRWVRSVGDIVLVNDIVERMSDPEDEEESD